MPSGGHWATSAIRMSIWLCNRYAYMCVACVCVCVCVSNLCVSSPHPSQNHARVSLVAWLSCWATATRVSGLQQFERLVILRTFTQQSVFRPLTNCLSTLNTPKQETLQLAMTQKLSLFWMLAHCLFWSRSFKTRFNCHSKYTHATHTKTICYYPKCNANRLQFILLEIFPERIDPQGDSLGTVKHRSRFHIHSFFLSFKTLRKKISTDWQKDFPRLICSLFLLPHST